MGGSGRWDLARQAANVVGALFQIGAPVLTGEAVGRVSAENGTLVVPADYAFVIWSRTCGWRTSRATPER